MGPPRGGRLFFSFVIVGVFLIANVATTLAFNQKVEIDGVRIETDKAVYFMADFLNYRLYLVNKLDDPITVCIGGYDLTIRNAFGMGIGVSLNSFLGPGCEKYVIPGAEVLAGKNYVPLSGWSLPLPPGRYLVEATVRTYPDMGEPFYGRARVLIVIVPPL